MIMLGRLKDRIIEIGPLLVFISIWEIIARANIFPSYFLPPFSQVILQFVNLTMNGELGKNFLVSLLRVSTGFLLGASSGILIGVILGYSELLEKALSPLFYIFYSIPVIGWVPLFLIWIGINELLPIAIVFICSFFPIMYNTFTGIKIVDKQIINAAKTLGASNLQILETIVIPLALPNIFTGLKLEAGMAWRTVIAAEMIAMPIGLGALAMKAQSLLLVDVIIVILLLLALICFISEIIFDYLERRLTAAWR